MFIDETWVKTNMVRTHGWGPKGQRVPGQAPFGHWRTMTFLAALRRCWVFLYPDEDNEHQIHLTVNTTLLRQPNEAILAAFERALHAGWTRS